MPKYLVRVEGNNVFLRDADSQQPRRMGFFTTRMIEAAEEDGAIADAMRLIRDQLADEGILGNSLRPLEMTFDEISIVDQFHGQPPGKGFAFYPDQDH